MNVKQVNRHIELERHGAVSINGAPRPGLSNPGEVIVVEAEIQQVDQLLQLGKFFPSL